MNASGKVAARAIICESSADQTTPSRGSVNVCELGEQDDGSSLEGGNSTDLILDAMAEGIALVPKDFQKVEVSDEMKSLRLENLRRAMNPDPLKRMKRSLMFKAFIKWKDVYPITQKCDELGRQLQERLSALHIVRESYIRDVLCVKFHVDKLNEATLKNAAQVKAQADTMMAQARAQAEQLALEAGSSQSQFEMGLSQYSESASEMVATTPLMMTMGLTPANNMITENIPSVDLRPLVKKVQDAPHMSSTQLRETMIKAGFISGVSDKVTKPWERGPTFRNLLKDQKGPKYRMPVGGETIAVHAPNKHTLFVNYCKQCTGMMHLVYQWNHEVEAALQFWREREDKTWESEKQNKIAQTIANLNDALYAAELENKKLHDRIKELEDSEKWFEEWEFAKGAHTELEMLSEKLAQSKSINALLHEDNAASIEHIKDHYEARLIKSEEANTLLTGDLVRLRTQYQIEKREVLDLTAQLAQKDNDAALAKNELTAVFTTLEEEREASRVLKHKVEGSAGLFAELTHCLEKKEAAFAAYKAETDAKIEDMKAVIASMVTDYDLKESEVDKLRDELYNQKQEHRETKSELAQMEAQLAAEIKAAKDQYDHTVKTMCLKKKHSLRRVAMLIRHIVHIARRNRVKHANEVYRARMEFRNELVELGQLQINPHSGSFAAAGMVMMSPTGRGIMTRMPSRMPSRRPSFGGGSSDSRQLSARLRDAAAGGGIAAAEHEFDEHAMKYDAGAYLQLMEWAEICELTDMHSLEISELHDQRAKLLNENHSLRHQLGTTRFIAQSQRALAVKLEKLVFSLRCNVFVLRKGHDKHHVRKDGTSPGHMHAHGQGHGHSHSHIHGHGNNSSSSNAAAVLPSSSGCATGSVTPFMGSMTPMLGDLSRAQSNECFDTSGASTATATGSNAIPGVGGVLAVAGVLNSSSLMSDSREEAGTPASVDIEHAHDNLAVGTVDAATVAVPVVPAAVVMEMQQEEQCNILSSIANDDGNGSLLTSSSGDNSSFEEDDFFALYGISGGIAEGDEGEEDEDDEEGEEDGVGGGEAGPVASMAGADASDISEDRANVEHGKRRVKDKRQVSTARPVDKLKGYARELTTRIRTWNFTRPLKLFDLQDVTKHFATENNDGVSEKFRLRHQFLEEERVVAAYCGSVKSEFDKLTDRNMQMLQNHKSLLDQIASLTEQQSAHAEETAIHLSKIGSMQQTINELESKMEEVLSHVHDFSHSVNADSASIASGVSRHSSRHSNRHGRHRHGHGRSHGRSHRHGGRHAQAAPSRHGSSRGGGAGDRRGSSSRRSSRSLLRHDSSIRGGLGSGGSKLSRHDSRSRHGAVQRGSSGIPAPMLRSLKTQDSLLSNTTGGSSSVVASAAGSVTGIGSDIEEGDEGSPSSKPRAASTDPIAALSPAADKSEAAVPPTMAVPESPPKKRATPVALPPGSPVTGTETDAVSLTPSNIAPATGAAGSASVASADRSTTTTPSPNKPRRSPSLKTRQGNSNSPSRHSSSRPRRSPSRSSKSQNYAASESGDGEDAGDSDTPADDIDAHIDQFLKKVQALAPSVPLKLSPASPTQSTRKSLSSVSVVSGVRRSPSLKDDGSESGIKLHMNESLSPVSVHRRSPSIERTMTAVSDCVEQLRSSKSANEESVEEGEYFSDSGGSRSDRSDRSGSATEASYDSYEEAIRERKLEMKRSVKRHSIFSMNNVHYLRRHSAIKSIRRMCARGIAKEVLPLSETESAYVQPLTPGEGSQKIMSVAVAEASLVNANDAPIPITDSGPTANLATVTIPMHKPVPVSLPNTPVAAVQGFVPFEDSDVSDAGLVLCEQKSIDSVSPLSIPGMGGRSNAGCGGVSDSGEPTVNMTKLLNAFGDGGGDSGAANANGMNGDQQLTLDELEQRLDREVDDDGVTLGSFDDEDDESSSIMDESIYDDDTISLIGNNYPRSYRNWKIIILRAFTKVHDEEESILSKFSNVEMSRQIADLMDRVEEMEFSERRSTRALTEQQLELDSLTRDVAKKVIIIRTLRQDLVAIKEELAELNLNYEENVRENGLLRKGLEDSYRRTSDELLNAAEEFQKLQQTEAQLARKRQRNRTTQISCMTCDYKPPAVTFNAHELFSGMNADGVPICVPTSNPNTGLLKIDTERLTPAGLTTTAEGTTNSSRPSTGTGSGLPSSAHRYQPQPRSQGQRQGQGGGIGKLLKTFSAGAVGGSSGGGGTGSDGKTPLPGKRSAIAAKPSSSEVGSGGFGEGIAIGEAHFGSDSMTSAEAEAAAGNTDFNPILSNDDIYGTEAMEKVLLTKPREINCPVEEKWEYSGIIVDHSRGREASKVLSTAELGTSLAPLTTRANYTNASLGLMAPIGHAIASSHDLSVAVAAGAGAAGAGAARPRSSTRRPQSAMASLSRTGSGTAVPHYSPLAMTTFGMNSNSLPPSAVDMSGANLSGGITGVTGPALIQGTVLDSNLSPQTSMTNPGIPSPFLSQTMLTSASLSKFTRLKNFPQQHGNGRDHTASAPLLSQSYSATDVGAAVGAHAVVMASAGQQVTATANVSHTSLSDARQGHNDKHYYSSAAPDAITGTAGSRARPLTAGAAASSTTVKSKYYTDHNPNVSIATRDTVDMNIELTPTAVTIMPPPSDGFGGDKIATGGGKAGAHRTSTKRSVGMSTNKSVVKEGAVMSSLIQEDMVRKLGIDLNSAYRVLEDHERKQQQQQQRQRQLTHGSRK